MKKLALHPLSAGFLVLLSFYIRGLQLSALAIEGHQSPSVYEGHIPLRRASEGHLDSSEDKVFQPPFYPFAVRRINPRLGHLKLHPVSQTSYALALARAIEMLPVAHNSFRPEQVNLCFLPIDLGINPRKIPAPESTDELPAPYLA